MRLIDADALPRLMQIFEANEKRREQEVVLAKIIDNAPTVDAVPVVRCKDCKWWTPIVGTHGCEAWSKIMLAETDADDFCSYGERKDDE